MLRALGIRYRKGGWVVTMLSLVVLLHGSTPAFAAPRATAAAAQSGSNGYSGTATASSPGSTDRTTKEIGLRSSKHRSGSWGKTSLGSARDAQRTPSVRRMGVTIKRGPRIPSVRPRQMFIPECYGPNNEFLCAPPSTPSVPAAPQKRGRAVPTAPVWTYSMVEQVVRRVDVSLVLPDPTIRVGPDPSVNEWNMAVVGYPLWLWSDSPAVVSRTASRDGLSFTLTGRRTQVQFDMGDGTTLTCSEMTPFDSSVEPATPSPTCGHVYETASLPEGRYTIRATSTWSVTWSSLGFSGVLPGQTTTTRTLPVGELQSVLRR